VHAANGDVDNESAEINRHDVAFRFAERQDLPHGLAGDERVLFLTEPFRGRVAVIDRLSGSEIAELPSPPGGFRLPFSARTEGTNKIVILDSDQFPKPGLLPIPQVHVYSYVAQDGAFTAALERSITVSVPIVFSEDLEVIGPSRYVVSDAGFVVDHAGAVLDRGTEPIAWTFRCSPTYFKFCDFSTGTSKTLIGVARAAHALASEASLDLTCRSGVVIATGSELVFPRLPDMKRTFMRLVTRHVSDMLVVTCLSGNGMGMSIGVLLKHGGRTLLSVALSEPVPPQADMTPMKRSGVGRAW
jgi:hypothetical protein